MNLTIEDITERRTFLALVGTAAVVVSIMLYFILNDSRKDGTKYPSSSGDSGPRGLNQSGGAEGGDEPAEPSVDVQVSGDVATVVVDRVGWAEVFVVEWFDAPPEDAEGAVLEGYEGDVVTEIAAQEGSSDRLLDLEPGGYVVVASSGFRRFPAGSFGIGEE